MFKNEYQGGPFVEIFSSQGKDPVAKWKLCGSPAVQKVFDKEVKSYVYILEGSSQRNKMQLPKDSKQTLGLIQRFLVLQLCVPVGQDFSTELLSHLAPRVKGYCFCGLCRPPWIVCWNRVLINPASFFLLLGVCVD
ncbi:hypothetical protein scyTo_0014980 [Scyliorhinus torazame]|uniref:CFA20 domain-containing protein n=1 Tax=Scyliorhinus torazame TaxID=75743 RepID=A0A401NZP0_SCYTO|nr:hypothetical protein [Scyliorhinus torazame]